jgi:hypothetical protein
VTSPVVPVATLLQEPLQAEIVDIREIVGDLNLADDANFTLDDE